MMKTVLLIDDDPMMKPLLSPLLNTLGMQRLLSTSNGREALNLIDEESDELSLILCDLHMPGMDGIELLRHLGERNYSGKVIIISGSHPRLLGSVLELAKAHNLNILGALEKPVSLKSMVDMLKNHTPQKN